MKSTNRSNRRNSTCSARRNASRGCGRLYKATRDEIADQRTRAHSTSVAEAVKLYSNAEVWAADIVAAFPGTAAARDAQMLTRKASDLVVKAQVAQIKSGYRNMAAFDAAVFHNRLAQLVDLSARVGV